MPVFILCGVMVADTGVGSGTEENPFCIEVMPGCLIAASEAEALASHRQWMQYKMPNYEIAAIRAFIMPEDILRKAAADLSAKDQKQDEDNHNEAKPAG